MTASVAKVTAARPEPSAAWAEARRRVRQRREDMLRHPAFLSKQLLPNQQTTTASRPSTTSRLRVGADLLERVPAGQRRRLPGKPAIDDRALAGASRSAS